MHAHIYTHTYTHIHTNLYNHCGKREGSLVVQHDQLPLVYNLHACRVFVYAVFVCMCGCAYNMHACRVFVYAVFVCICACACIYNLHACRVFVYAVFVCICICACIYNLHAVCSCMLFLCAYVHVFTTCMPCVCVCCSCVQSCIYVHRRAFVSGRLPQSQENMCEWKVATEPRKTCVNFNLQPECKPVSRGHAYEPLLVHMHMRRVGQDRIYTPYMTVYLVISLPKIPYVHRIYMVLAKPTHALPMLQVCCAISCSYKQEALHDFSRAYHASTPHEKRC